MANISRTKLLRIYNSLVRTIIEYGCPVWQITPTENMKTIRSDPEKRIINMLGVTSNIRKRGNGSRRQHTTS